MDVLFAAPIGALLIFGLRVVDVSMAIVRMIMAVRGYRALAAVIGFVEVLIWLFAAGAALQHLDSVYHVVGYAAGFAAGNYVGIWLENRFALGVNVVRAVCPAPTEANLEVRSPTADALREAGFAVTEIGGRGREQSVTILDVVVPRRRVNVVLDLVREHEPDAFVTVEEVRSMRGGYVRPGGRKMPFLARG
ncbi:MAG: DUF2179 domain-containing protein [Bacteroidetes bacterium]|jgi:uncharacterized protein YebE (UPF0316 family)|nr:DUF2179 domain-containing protein [Bacteroidota bacterium]